MIVAQCVLVAALVLVYSTSSLTMPTTAMNTPSTSTPEQNVTSYTTISPQAISEDDNMTTENTGTTTDQLATFFNITSTSVESIATMTKPKVTNETNVLSSLNNDFVFTSAWIIAIAVGGFTLLTAMPLLIIMILIVALGCMCKKYKRMKKRLITPTEIVASNNHYGEMPTAMESGVELRNILYLDDIDTGENVAYGRTTAVVERCDIADNMTMQNAETDRQSCETRNNIATVEDIAQDGMSTEVKGCDNMNIEDNTAETNGETDCGSYVINDLYDSIT